MIAQASSSESVHPDVRRAADSIHLPEVQELVKRLAEYGLAVALPHMHGDDGMLAPCPPIRLRMRTACESHFSERMIQSWSLPSL